MDDPWQSGGLPLLNIAATVPATRALGPGLRAAAWVQGCCFNCPGCISPEWIPKEIARQVTPQDLASELLANPEIEGLTFSGGEPMLQAAGLASVIRLARLQRQQAQQAPLSVISFTGFTLEQLQRNPANMPGIADFLAEIDVLIDGLYRAELNDSHGLRGSSNQRIHYLTGRLVGSELENRPRQSEVHIGEGYAFLVGVPAPEVLRSFQQALDKVRKWGK
jgi:anaerobic ribonucleoside-triphosphate reductase activating protein